MVLPQDNVVFGSVNANRSHYEAGAAALAAVDPPGWGGLSHGPFPSISGTDAYTRQPDDVKTVLSFSE